MPGHDGVRDRPLVLAGPAMSDAAEHRRESALRCFGFIAIASLGLWMAVAALITAVL